MTVIGAHDLWGGGGCPFAGLTSPDGACPCCDLHVVRVGADYGEPS